MSRRPVLLLAGTALLLAACSGPRAGSSVTSAVSGCATVLPAARALVGPGPALVSLHALRGRLAATTLAELGVPPAPDPDEPGTAPPDRSEPADALPRTCAIVYRGPFPAAVVAQALPGSSGAYAVVLVRVRHPESHTLVLVPVVPTRLRRT